MAKPQEIVEWQARAQKMSLESQKQLHSILKHAETTGKAPRLSQHFTPEALSESQPSVVAAHSSRQVRQRPDRDARLPVLEERINRDWNQYRPKYYRQLRASGTLRQQIRQTALMCVETLHQYQKRGLNPDQAREAIQELITP
ncbi:MAG TPA: hypothetical protein VME68_15425 [Acidobacteriaceae bacterium]|nr:hypothetical protein [Acidobacteriaceae bacterium]